MFRMIKLSTCQNDQSTDWQVGTLRTYACIVFDAAIIFVVSSNGVNILEGMIKEYSNSSFKSWTDAM